MFSTKTTTHNHSGFSLYTADGKPKYLNQAERKRFLECASTRDKSIRLLCHVLVYSGCRLTEALNLSRDSILEPEKALSIRSLKKRSQVSFRHVPVPNELIKELVELSQENPSRLFKWQRTQALHHVKQVMKSADIDGVRGTARGLRHTFGTHGMHRGIPLTLLQRWFGHSKLEMTAIYTQVLGQEERDIASKMW